MTTESLDFGSIATFGGAATACVGSTSYLANENTLILLISGVGAIIALMGFVYTVWSGERHYRMTLAELELRKRELGLGGENVDT